MKLSNKELIEQFTWLDANPESNEWVYGNAESNCWFDNFEQGWQDLGYEMCKEIQSVLEKYNLVDKFEVHQIKEKYGELRFYWGFTKEDVDRSIFDELHEINRKYENLSRRTCIVCGKPAKYITTGWISPYCENCIKPNWKIKKIYEN